MLTLTYRKDIDIDMDRIPRTGEIYRHFKNKLYQIAAVATHSETGEQLVIYQALYGDYQVYARPLAMFTSEVDHEKYPEVEQKYRFERVDREELGSGAGALKTEEVLQQDTSIENSELQEETVNDTSVIKDEDTTMAAATANSDENVNPKLMAFFDADDLEEKYNILISMRDELNDHLINSMAVALDVVIAEGEISDRYDQLKHCIRTKQRYETSRLR